MANSRGFNVSDQLAAYLRSEISEGSPRRQKIALQQLCKLCRAGHRIRPNDCVRIENAILGAINSAPADEKVRRWGIAALTYVGNDRVSGQAVVTALRSYSDEPQVVAAAIATLYKLKGEAANDVIRKENSLSPELVALSAYQAIGEDRFRFPKPIINIETSEPLSLKLSLILVGMDRAPDNLFDPKYTNGQIVKVLGGHDEPLVSQYSVWAATENSKLGVGDLGINQRDIGDQPPNVRGYIYRLYADIPGYDYSSERYDVIARGRVDDDEDARLGLAIGLKDCYFNGVEEIILGWLRDSDEDEIQAHLLDHIITQNEKFEMYKTVGEEEYTAAQGNPTKRRRMEACAAGTDLFKLFRKIDMENETGSLFPIFGGPNVSNFNINNSGEMNIGAVSQSGKAQNQGGVKSNFSESEMAILRGHLDNAETQISGLPTSVPYRSNTLGAISEAKKDLTPSRAEKVVNLLKKLEEGMAAVKGMAEHASGIAVTALAIGAMLV